MSLQVDGQCLPVSSGILLQKRKLQKRKRRAKSLKTSASPMNISEVTVENEERIPTGIHELDRVLGGGIVKGSYRWSEEIRESWNPRYYYRYQGILRTANVRFCIFLGKNLCIRSR